MIIIVQDNGKGFDEELVEVCSMNIELGRGFFNMYECIEYINGNLDIKFELGKGIFVVFMVLVKIVAIVE